MSAVVRARDYKAYDGVLSLSVPKDKNGRTSQEVVFNGDSDTYATLVLDGGGWFTAKSGFQAGQFGPYSCVTVNDEDEVKGLEAVDADLIHELTRTSAFWPKRPNSVPLMTQLEGCDEEGVRYQKCILLPEKKDEMRDSRLMCLNYDIDKKTGMPAVTIIDPSGHAVAPHLLPNKNWKKLYLELRSVQRKKPMYFGFSVKCIRILLDGTEGAPLKRHAELPPDDDDQASAKKHAAVAEPEAPAVCP